MRKSASSKNLMLVYSDTAVHCEKQQTSSLADERVEDEGYEKNTYRPDQGSTRSIQ